MVPVPTSEFVTGFVVCFGLFVSFAFLLPSLICSRMVFGISGIVLKEDAS